MTEHATNIRSHVTGRHAIVAALAGALVVGGCQASPTPQGVTVEQARADLRDLILDVTASDGHRYQLTDNLGRPMGPTEILYVPEAELFAAVYFTASDPEGIRYHVQLATSSDLFIWTWQVDLADQASQPSIAAADGGGYVVAWEQEPDPIHNVIAYYETWNDLRAGTASRRFDVPITMPACGEGTPSIEAASAARVELGFHYHADCFRDLQAGGSTDWDTWQATMRLPIDLALSDQGASHHIGDRDTILFEGHNLMEVEGQSVPDDWSTWRLYLYDDETQLAEPLPFRTHGGSTSMANPTITRIELEGRPAILVTLYIFTEGAAPGEDGGLLFYRYLDPPAL